MNIFKTLLLREWMQHKLGWAVLLALPFVLLLLAVTFGTVQIEDMNDIRAVTALAGLLGIASIASTLAVMWLAVMFQLGSLARRDVQDRSIEFWLSLPTPPLSSVSATVLTHLVLAPWVALACGLAGAAVIAPVLVLKVHGVAGLIATDWPGLAVAGLAIIARVAFGVVLATLWLSPLMLGAMAAASWLKRWGVPAVAAGIAVGGGLERGLMGSHHVYDAVQRLFDEASRAVLMTDRGGPEIKAEGIDGVIGLVPQIPGMLVYDMGHALGRLAQPAFVATVAIGAVMFSLLVLRRQRGG